eukprot:3239914-Pleurochrysis_carterae.AAC.1
MERRSEWWLRGSSVAMRRSRTMRAVESSLKGERTAAVTGYLRYVKRRRRRSTREAPEWSEATQAHRSENSSAIDCRWSRFRRGRGRKL